MPELSRPVKKSRPAKYTRKTTIQAVGAPGSEERKVQVDDLFQRLTDKVTPRSQIPIPERLSLPAAQWWLNNECEGLDLTSASRAKGKDKVAAVGGLQVWMS